MIIPVAAVFLFIVFVLGPAIDAGAKRSEEQALCLKGATDGLEIEQCR